MYSQQQQNNNVEEQDRQPVPQSQFPVLYTLSPNPKLINSFPQTRYYGSKRRLLSWLYSELLPIDFTTVLDAFGGTASVSQLFRLMQKEVTYHDALQFNVDVARTILSDTLAFDHSFLASFLEAVEPHCGVVSRNFENIFFLQEENLWIDGFMHAVDATCLGGDEISLLRYLLYQACLKKRPFNIFHRANLSLRTNSSIVRSFGNFTTWEKSFNEHILLAYEDLILGKFLSKYSAQILPPNDATCIVGDYDMVYIDPPYVSLKESYNRDNYWRRYHFLEGLSKYSSWDKQLDSSSDIKMMKVPDHFISWSKKATFRDRLFQFIDSHKQSIVVLSYVDNAYPSREEIQCIFETHFAAVKVRYLELSHALSRGRRREYLWIGLPK